MSLRSIESGELVHVVNTHYDDQGVKARAQSSLMLRHHVLSWSTKVEEDERMKSGPVILLGDFSEYLPYMDSPLDTVD